MAYADHHTATLYAAIATEIRDVRTLIETLAESLVSDEAFALANIQHLQTFDLVIQRADESADLIDRILSGAPSHEAIDKVRLSFVQNKLRSALASQPAAA